MTMKEAIARYRDKALDQNESAERVVELFEEFAEPHLISTHFHH